MGDMDAEKLSAEKNISIRPGELRPMMEATLAILRRTNPDATLSGMARAGLAAYWPQISAFLLARHQTTLPSEQLAALTAICAKAMENGLTAADLEAQISDALAARFVAINTGT